MLIPPAARHANPLSIGWRAAPPLSRWDNRDYSRPPPRSGGGPRPVRIRRTGSGAHSCSYEEDKFLNTLGDLRLRSPPSSFPTAASTTAMCTNPHRLYVGDHGYPAPASA